MPATTTRFPLFSFLPEEIREHIWIEALPGPRIVYIQCLLKYGLHPHWAWFDETLPRPQESYFTSTSPNRSILSLLHACKESSRVTRKHYSSILRESESVTWFSFDKDFLYLDWGRRWGAVPYGPTEFKSSQPEEYHGWDKNAPPKIQSDVAIKVKNLVIFYRDNNFYDLEQRELLGILSIFTGVDTLVMANQLHDVYEAGEELVWLQGEAETKVEENLVVQDMILWRDDTQYGFFPEVDLSVFETEWAKANGKVPMPKILRRSITTSRVKNILIQICGSEHEFWKVQTLDWGYVMGISPYKGTLDLSQQVMYLELAADRLSIRQGEFDCIGFEMEGSHIWDMLGLGPKIDELNFEREILELIISDAGEMAIGTP